MTSIEIISVVSIITAGLTMCIGGLAPAFGEAKALTQALESLAQQPDAANSITRTLFVGLAMIETTGIFCFVISMILLFVNPYWKFVVENIAR